MLAAAVTRATILSARKRISTSSDIDNTGGRSPSTREVGVPLLVHPNTKRPKTATEQTRVLRAYAAALALGTIVLFSALYSQGYHLGPLVPTAVMALVALISEKQNVRLNPHLEISVSFLPALFAVVAFGPISAMVVALVSLIGDLGRPWERWVIWTGSRCLVLCAAGLAATAAGSSDTLVGLFAAALAASGVVLVGESLAGAITLSIRRESGIYGYFSEIFLVSSIGMLANIPVIAGLVYIYVHVSPWAVALSIGPAIAAQRFFILYKEQIKTSGDLNDAVRQLEKVNLSFATVLVAALDARDHYTAGHSAAVAVYARDIAKRLGLSDEEVRRAHLCGLLHDIGKIGVPTGVLEKRGPLVRDERMAIETHAEVGASILERIEGYEEIALAVRHHHERFSGGGYPDRVQGDDIPLLARLVAVADAYSAMTSERPYRIALSGAEALERLEREAGKQFDPRVVKAFVVVLEQAGEAYTSGADRDFEVELAELAAFESGPSLAISS
jgi:putative nucleotidyltransferase with HDIG domain